MMLKELFETLELIEKEIGNNCEASFRLPKYSAETLELRIDMYPLGRGDIDNSYHKVHLFYREEILNIQDIDLINHFIAKTKAEIDKTPPKKPWE